MGYTSDGGGEKNWLQRLAEKIPGLAGYQAKETRREVDKLYREHLADRLRKVKDHLAAVMRDMTDGGRLFEIAPVERLSKKVDTLENRVRYATYGYAGFFDAVKIEEPQLDAIYRFDLSLVEKVEEFERHARELASKSSTPDGLKAAAAEIERAADDLNRTFDERYRAIETFGPDDAQGQPMFS